MEYMVEEVMVFKAEMPLCLRLNNEALVVLQSGLGCAYWTRRRRDQSLYMYLIGHCQNLGIGGKDPGQILVQSESVFLKC